MNKLIKMTTTDGEEILISIALLHVSGNNKDGYYFHYKGHAIKIKETIKDIQKQCCEA